MNPPVEEAEGEKRRERKKEIYIAQAGSREEETSVKVTLMLRMSTSERAGRMAVAIALIE